MSERCDDLDQFFDRELGTEAAHAFRDHLATCARCQRALHGRMLEAAVVASDHAGQPSVVADHAGQPSVATDHAGQPSVAADAQPSVAADHPVQPSVAADHPVQPSVAADQPAQPSVAADQPSVAADQAQPSVAADQPAQPSVGSAGKLAATVAAPAGEDLRPADQPGATVDELHAHRLRRLLAVTAAIITSAAAAVLLKLASGGDDDTAGISSAHNITYSVAVLKVIERVTDHASGGLIALGPERGVEVRFSAPALDHYRKYAVVRAAGAAPHERITLQGLAELERLGKVNTLVGALALNGDLTSASQRATELPKTAPSLADRAALELLQVDRATDRAGRPTHEVAAERALSLTTEALRLDPTCAQARWNRAIALRRLGLSLVAVRMFDEIGESHEAGWSDEATTMAERLRREYRVAADNWTRMKADADRMVLGGPALTDNQVSRAPSLARDTFYKALATTSTTAGIDALAALAHTLDARFATTALSDLLTRVRASDLRARAPFAAELRTFIDPGKPRDTINSLRARAIEHGVPDIALASFLVVPERATEAEDLPLLDQLMLHNRDPWWKLIQLARHEFISEFRDRDYLAVDAIERLAAPICETTHSALCGRITLFAGGANSQMGRADLAIQQITAARRLASDAALPDDELAAIDALGQAISIRVADDIDSSAVAGAYLEEVALRKNTCTTRLQRLDFAATAALQYHRFDDAARYRRDADELERGECRDAYLRLNGETARLRLLLLGRARLDTLRANLVRLESDGRPNHRLYLDFLGAAATLVEDRQRGEAALRQVIAAANADPHRTHAPLMRASSFDVLVESAAGSGDAKAVLALLTERVAAPSYDRCVLGVASWNRLVIAMLDAGGKPALETREIPTGVVVLPPQDVISPTLRARLAGCPRVEVLTSGPYFGAPKLLGDDMGWLYHAGTPRTSRGVDSRHELVVSDVTPPARLNLPALQPFSGGDGAKVLSGPGATPEHVLAEMKAANLIVIVAHGFTDASEPTAASLILSPDPQGDYLLTASKVSAVQLTRSPIVVLAGCDAGRVQVSAEPWSLATSFIHAGARVVIAPTEPIPDASASEVFRSLVDRIRAGADPVDALAAERSSRGATAAWLSSVVVFE
jgi:hypothetical protein